MAKLGLPMPWTWRSSWAYDCTQRERLPGREDRQLGVQAAQLARDDAARVEARPLDVGRRAVGQGYLNHTVNNGPWDPASGDAERARKVEREKCGQRQLVELLMGGTDTNKIIDSIHSRINP